MHFEYLEQTDHPRPLVFRTHRDHLMDVVDQLDTVRSVSLLSRTDHAGGIVELSHRWVGSEQALPVLFRPITPPELLVWHDITTWRPAQWRCDWTIEVPALGPTVHIHGVNTFEETDRGCAVRVHGDFEFHPERVPQLAGLPPQMIPLIERFVVGLILPMLKQSGRAVATWLDQRPGGS